jgi:hypothetical protein
MVRPNFGVVGLGEVKALSRFSTLPGIQLETA